MCKTVTYYSLKFLKGNQVQKNNLKKKLHMQNQSKDFNEMINLITTIG